MVRQRRFPLRGLRLVAVMAVGCSCWLLAGPGLADQTGDGAGGPQNQIRLDRPASRGDGGSTATSSGGQPATFSDIAPDESVRLFRAAGFESVELIEDAKDGDYLKVRSEGRTSFVFHLNCTAGRCRSLMFMAFLDARRGANLNFVNGYNLKTLHTKMSRNDSGEIVLQMAARLDGGVTAANLRALAPFWNQVYRDALAWK